MRRRGVYRGGGLVRRVQVGTWRGQSEARWAIDIWCRGSKQTKWEQDGGMNEDGGAEHALKRLEKLPRVL